MLPLLAVLHPFRIQQYTLLAKGAKGRAVSECIMKATAEPAVFGFRELMALSSVQEVLCVVQETGGCRRKQRSRYSLNQSKT